MHSKTGRTGIFQGFFQVSNGPDDTGPIAVVELSSGTIDTWAAENTVLLLPEEIQNASKLSEEK